MKYLLSLFLLMPTVAMGQKIVENKTDEFTKTRIIRTSWEKLQQGLKGTIFIRMSKIDDEYFLSVKMMLPGGSGGDIFSISEGSDFMFKLNNNDVLKVASIEYATTGIGEGARGFGGSQAWGIKVVYQIPPETLQQLKEADVDKIRIYTNDGYVEYEIGNKKSGIINKSAKLILENS